MSSFYQRRREPLTIEERERLVNACRTHREKLCIWILLDTGLRVSELANLTPEAVQENQIAIYKKTGPHRKKLKKRIVPLTDRCRKLLETHFSLGDGMGITTRTIQRIVAKVAINAGIKKVTPQVLRKSFIVKCLRRGISILTLQRILDRQLITTDLWPEDPRGEEALKDFFSKW